MPLIGITQANKIWLLFTHQQRTYWHWSINNNYYSLLGEINIIFTSFCLPPLLLSSFEELPFLPPASDELPALLHPPYELEQHDTVLDLADHQCACKTISTSFMKIMEVKQLSIKVSFRKRRTLLILLFPVPTPWKTYCVSFTTWTFFSLWRPQNHANNNYCSTIMVHIKSSLTDQILFLHWQPCWMTIF